MYSENYEPLLKEIKNPNKGKHSMSWIGRLDITKKSIIYTFNTTFMRLSSCLLCKTCFV
jgi:hypothetical protein